jgi:hypothetical protein
MVKVYINRHVVAANQKSGERKPPITILRSKGQRSYALDVELHGNVRVVYSPDKPLSCGARVWIECDDAIAIEARGINGSGANSLTDALSHR